MTTSADARVKAYAVQEDCENTGDIYYAKHAITAKKRYANEYNNGELSGVTCHRAPWADQYAPGPCPRLVMIDNGWWLECHGCGVRIDSDLEVYPADPKEPVIELKPVEDVRGLWCTSECRERDLADRAERERAELKATADVEAALLAKLPGIQIIHPSHAYVVKRDGTYVPQQVRVAFNFPGSKIGQARFGHDEVGEEPSVTVCAGDLAAWKTWRAAIAAEGKEK